MMKPCAQAYVFDTVLQLAADPIANVRLQLLELLPRLKQTLRLPDHVDKLVRRLKDLSPHPSSLLEPHLRQTLTLQGPLRSHIPAQHSCLLNRYWQRVWPGLMLTDR